MSIAMKTFWAEFLIFRHGETDWNKNYKIQGHSDIPLNDEGRAQAAELAKKLGSFQIHHIVSSDLKRAEETARIALQETGLKIETHRDLREAHMGEYEGVDRMALQHQAAGELWRRWISSKNEDYDFALPGGENKREHQKRMKRFLQKAVLRLDQKTVAVSTHGGSLRRLLQLTDFEAPEQWLVKNCALHLIRVEARTKVAGQSAARGPADNGPAERSEANLTEDLDSGWHWSWHWVQEL